MACTWSSCANAGYCKGLCQKHYTQLRRGKLGRTKEETAQFEFCQIDGCDSKHQAKGMCNSHYMKANRSIYNSATMRRRAKKKANGSYKVTAKDVKRLMSEPCLLCDNPSEHLDHVIPISRGGRHSVGNLIGLCAFHNQSKNAKLLIEYKNKLIKEK